MVVPSDTWESPTFPIKVWEKRRDTGGKKKKRKPLDIFINNEAITLYRAAEKKKKFQETNKKATSTSTIWLKNDNY